MKNLPSFEEFLNEAEIINTGSVKMINNVVNQIEKLTKKHGKDPSTIKELFDASFEPQFTQAISKFKPAEKSKMIKILKSLKGKSLSKSIANVLSEIEDLNIQESNMILEKIDWKKIGQSIGNAIKKGAKWSWENAILPFLKYLINVLSRLIFNVSFAMINAIFNQEYLAPNATLFGKEETDGELSYQYD
jgi:hypothetical protein